MVNVSHQCMHFAMLGARRAAEFLLKRVSVAIQRNNAMCRLHVRPM